MPKVKELVKQITDEINSSYAVIQSTYDQWFSGNLTNNLTNDDWIEYYGAKKTLCERAWKESHSLPTFKEQKKLESKYMSAWRMYNQLRREKRENIS